MHHGRISDDAQVAAGTSYAGFTERNNVVVVRDILFDPAIEIFVLEEDDRIVVADGGFDQALGIVCGGRADDF